MNQSLKKNDCKSQYIHYPPRLQVSPPWVIWRWKVLGGDSVSYLSRRLLLGIFPPFSHCETVVTRDKKGRGRGKRRRRTVRELSLELSVISALQLSDLRAITSAQGPGPTSEMGIMTARAMWRGCGDDYLRKYMWEKCLVNALMPLLVLRHDYICV